MRYANTKMNFPLQLDESASTVRLLLNIRYDEKTKSRLNSSNLSKSYLAILPEYDESDRNEQLCKLVLSLRDELSTHDVQRIEDAYREDTNTTSPDLSLSLWDSMLVFFARLVGYTALYTVRFRQKVTWSSLYTAIVSSALTASIILVPYVGLTLGTLGVLVLFT